MLKKATRPTLSPFVPNAPFPYPLKTPENLMVFCFQGIEKSALGTNRLSEHVKNILNQRFSDVSRGYINLTLTYNWLHVSFQCLENPETMIAVVYGNGCHGFLPRLHYLTNNQ